MINLKKKNYDFFFLHNLTFKNLVLVQHVKEKKRNGEREREKETIGWCV
jgi:hypothetical protein